MESGSLDTIAGTVERIVYADEDGQYTVARLQEAGKHELTTIVGPLVGLTPGESLELRGRWRTHPKFGRQFTVEGYTVKVPATLVGIEKYLSSGMVRGIGPKLAKRLVHKFQLETLDVIESQPERLLEVEGIGKKKQQEIVKAWDAQKGIREVMIFLQDHGVGPGFAARIYKQYGSGAISVVRSDPYRLAADVWGIGFRTADKIAERVGIDRESDVRVQAGVVFALEQLTDEGHVCCPFGDLVENASKLLEVSPEQTERAIHERASRRRLIVERDFTDQPVYLPGLHTAEAGAADRLSRLAKMGSSVPAIQIDKALQWVEEKTGLALADSQRTAVAAALTHKLVVITGGPGVGKTTIVRCIVAILQAKKMRVLLASPTGRAAKRLSEATGAEAKTIHRLLKFNPAERQFGYDEQNPLPADVIIIDETSMVDLTLLYHLLKAVPPTATLVLVGDIDQLPSVGPGSVLRDVITSGVSKVVELTEVFRQAEQSLIVSNAHKINRGIFPVIRPRTKPPLADFYFIQKEAPEEVVSTVKSLCAERIPRRFGLDPLDDIQVITPMHRGTVGAQNLNVELQACLNPRESAVERFGRSYRVNDKVMQVRNNYEKEVFNGDIGRIASVNRVDQYALVAIDGREVRYDFTELDELVPAYAISVHKSQGSEYPAVVLPLVTQHYVMLQRNLLYTGVTRAKKLLTIVGTTKALALAIRNDRMTRRFGYLQQRLQAGL